MIVLLKHGAHTAHRNFTGFEGGLEGRDKLPRKLRSFAIGAPLAFSRRSLWQLGFHAVSYRI